MSTDNHQKITDKLVEIHRQKYPEELAREQEIDKWYGKKLFDRKGGESNWDWKTMSNEHYLATSSEAKFLEKQKAKRRALYEQQMNDYQELFQFKDFDDIDNKVESKIKEIELKHHRERKELYNLLNQECASFGIWPYDYKNLYNRLPFIEKAAKLENISFILLKYGFLLLTLKALFVFLEINLYGVWLPLTMMGAGIILMFASGGNWSKKLFFLAALSIVFFKSGPGFDISYLTWQTWGLVVAIVVLGNWIGNITYKNRY